MLTSPSCCRTVFINETLATESWPNTNCIRYKENNTIKLYELNHSGWYSCCTGRYIFLWWDETISLWNWAANGPKMYDRPTLRLFKWRFLMCWQTRTTSAVYSTYNSQPITISNDIFLSHFTWLPFVVILKSHSKINNICIWYSVLK